MTGSSDGQYGIPESRNSGFLPTVASSSGIQSGNLVVVVVLVVSVVVVVVVVDFVGKVRGFSGTGYVYP